MSERGTGELEGASHSARADLLGSVPIFAGLTKALRVEIASASSTVQLPAGSWLFRQDDSADSLYVVLSGRLEVIVETPRRQVVRVLGRGAAVGELALVTESTRSASVLARRDTGLLELTRTQFGELLAGEPEFALALTRELGRELRASRALIPPPSTIPTTITLIGLATSRALPDVCTGLVSGLGRAGRVARMEEPEGVDASRFGPLLDRLEGSHRQVLLVVGSPIDGGSWTEFCLRQSDRIVALVSESDETPDWLQQYPRLQGCDLLVHQSAVDGSGIGRWVEALNPRATHLLREGPSFDGDLERAARRLAGKSVGIVLSGGGARGLAHIGVLDELLASGIAIDRVGGCSMGAYVGAMFALEQGPDEIRARCRAEFVDRNPLSDYTIPVVSLVRGTRAMAMLGRTFGRRTIESAPRAFFSVSCDLSSGELVVQDRGPLVESVAASMCVPGVLAPRLSGGRLLVDGGVLNNLPVAPMAASGEGPIIAVDVTAQFQPPQDTLPHRGWPRRREWTAWARRTMLGVDVPSPRLKETLVRSMAIGSVDAVESARRNADLLITPETGAVPMLDFGHMDQMIEVGRQAARTALDSAPEFPRFS
jgi:predicted acylesterase/phospholipase RssA